MCLSYYEYQRDDQLEFPSHPSFSRRPSNPKIQATCCRRPSNLHRGSTPTTNKHTSQDSIRKGTDEGLSSASYTFKDIYKRMGEFLGQGSSSTVESFVNIHTGRQCAVKIIKKTHRMYCRSEVINEIQVNNLFKGLPNIVQLLEYFEEDDKFYLIFEKISGGSLQQHIEKRKRLTEVEASRIIKNLTESLEILHSQGIAHRDIKPANVLCINPDSPYPVKLCDFDLCSKVGNSSRTPRLHSPVGSSDFMAPEVVNAFVTNQPTCNDPKLYYDKKCDLWSLGILMYILLCGYPPFTGHCGGKCGWDLGEGCEDCEDKLFSSIREDALCFPERDWSNISMEAKHLIESLLEKDVESRLEAEDVLCHPWIVSKGCSQQLHRKSRGDGA